MKAVDIRELKNRLSEADAYPAQPRRVPDGTAQQVIDELRGTVDPLLERARGRLIHP